MFLVDILAPVQIPGSAVVSTAVFGVPPKTFAAFDSAPFGAKAV
jgi:hypothetical protein